MPTESLTPEQILAALAESPARMAALTAGLTPDQWYASPERGEWSANTILAHLRACADVWGNYIRLILTQDKAAFRAISPRTWIKKTDYLKVEFQPALQAFTLQRADLLALLSPLALADWSRSAVVTKDGKVSERSVLSYAQSLALHEQGHLEQIAQIAITLRR